MKNKNFLISFILSILIVLSTTVLAVYNDANYTSDDIAPIATDLIGTGAVNFKPYISLVVIALVVAVLAGFYKKIRNAFDDY